MTTRGRTETDRRIARIEGQVRGLRAMVADDRPTSELLTLVAAIRSALDGVSVTVLSSHAEECLRRVDRGDDLAETLVDLREAVARCRG